MKHVTAILGVAILAGCSGQTSETAGNNNAATASANTQTAAPRILALQPGQWETTVEVLKMEMTGMPGTPMPQTPPTTTSQCITPEQANKPVEGIMAGGALPPGCVSESNNVTDGRIQATFSCVQSGVPTRVSMQGVISPTSYEMEMDLSAGEGQTAVRSDMRVRARRLGECQTAPAAQ
ncbi:DUF3617 domain-containing protein [Sphingosinicella sp. LHD-64]|uniref:DUF3617 domain-containing protein n=1 Tax=Sphingosinicella sp. LHD-64 TaxID=3072139 RepID=UPI0028103634|nr:DUF3617 domain-containing protein [Sphingosinicella sp. LHD-64]MDQ8755548.1 DUF3617 domain-containing protein [Sphingosinicella sp. LHD-64]